MPDVSRASAREGARHAGEDFYKYEGVSPAGSHKPNTAVPQAFYNAEAGVKRLTTETGAGQWGTSLSLAGAMFGLEVLVFQVRVSYDQKPYRRAVMETYGARCVASPSNETVYGRKVLAERPDHPGSLGIAISEAVELAAQRDDTKYALGSVLNHVLMHQTVIGIESIKQMEMADEYPDVVVGCTGGGSNFAGIAFPFIGAGLARGQEAAHHGRGAGGLSVSDAWKICVRFRRYRPLRAADQDAYARQHLHAAGLPCRGPALSRHGTAGVPPQGIGLIEASAYHQSECFAAGVLFAKNEGIVPAPEANHAVKGAIEEALRCKREGKAETILFNLCGHGHFDMAAYSDYAAGKLKDVAYDEKELAMALSGLPAVAA